MCRSLIFRDCLNLYFRRNGSVGEAAEANAERYLGYRPLEQSDVITRPRKGPAFVDGMSEDPEHPWRTEISGICPQGRHACKSLAGWHAAEEKLELHTQIVWS